MSAYATVEGLKIMDRECLVEALKVMFGEKAAHILFLDEPINLIGYEGDMRPEKAEIIIPGSGRKKNIVGVASNDIGFKQQEDGSWAPIISNYDSKKYNADWLKELTGQTALLKAERNAKKAGMTVQRKMNGTRIEKLVFQKVVAG